MSDTEIFALNRVILAHFDNYSSALVFARFGNTLLTPTALPEGAVATGAPADGDLDKAYAGGTVMDTAIARYGLNPSEVSRDSHYDAWMKAGGDIRIRIHLLRFRTFLAPVEVIKPHGGVFLPISALRGARREELGLIREAFNLIVGGEQSRG